MWAPLIPLSELIQLTTNIDPRKRPNEVFDYIDVSSVSKESLRIESTQTLLGKDAPSRARKLVAVNDIIFATIRPTLRRIAIVSEEHDGQVCSTAYVVLRARGEINHRWLFYFLQTETFIDRMESLQRGASYPAVTDSDVREALLPVPPLSEQHRIVALLDEAFESIDQAKVNAEKSLEAARETFDSYLASVFTKGATKWKHQRLSDVALIFGRGRSRHRPRNDPKLYGGKYPFIQTGDVRRSDHFITEFSQTYSELGLEQSKLWPAGTVCITIAANIAEIGILAIDACFPDSVIGVVVNPELTSNGYLKYLLQSLKARLKAQGKGSAQDNINLGTFEGQTFPFPDDLETQNRIVARLDELREATNQLQAIYTRKLEALDELKKSLLHQAFNGAL